MIVRSCVPKRTRSICPTCSPYTYKIARTGFHSSAGQRQDAGLVNHYEVLDVPTNAAPNDIKRSFYKLSKTYHPDLHPNDPSAAQKFVKISEAYATLGSPEKRARYDRDFLQTTTSSASSGHTPRGSYSSSSTSGPGGRPASGLSRRRTQFRGPPPSFYRSGGWGQQSEKRSEHASAASHTHEAQGRAASGPAGPGMGPGGFAAGFDNDVPHFDQRAHAQTHSEIERTRHRARRKVEQRRFVEVEEGAGTSTLSWFLLLTGALGVMFGLSSVIMGQPRAAPGKKQGNDGVG